MIRKPSLIDQIISRADTFLRVVFVPEKRPHQRDNPAIDIPDSSFTSTEKKHIAGLMRVNHAGEVCAQALYQGQACTAKLKHVKQQMIQAANEEIDHLAWCEQRLCELESKPSLLNPFWYVGSFCIGAFAGFIGDSLSLGFVAETERQVTAHLTRHLEQLPLHDKKTKLILEQMKIDETAHANAAIHAGGKDLPFLIKKLMYATSKLLTTLSYKI
jgi:3-demethoxyubiquinol 3-hydroxylase